jgi:hypothetical protein
MPKPRIEQIDDFMEGVEYGTLTPTVEVFDKETLRLALAEYEEAQKIGELELHPSFHLMMNKLEESALYHAKQQYDYRGVDPAEKEKRNQNQRQSAHAFEFVRSIFIDAREIPRPVLVKLPQ